VGGGGGARRCRFLTLGCKVNQYDTQWVKETLEASGWREADAEETPALCIVNTCTVTHEADAQARQLIRRLHRDHPAAAIVVMGCYASREPQTLARLPGVVQVIPDRAKLVEELRGFGVAHAANGIRRFDGHQRAFVKVQDGCLLTCTFCIIPKVRPAFASRPVAAIAAEVEALLETRTREIVLTGIHLGHYGIDLSRGKPKDQWTRLWHLIERLDALLGEFRIRLSSLEAAEARDDLLAAVANSRRVVPHFHLCLQSGSDRILAAMRRRYRAASFLRRCEEIRRRFDQPAITTDIIVGFPGETDADFEDTLRVAGEAGFARIHIFPYSRRKGTPAAELPNQVDPRVLTERRMRLAELDAELAAAYARRLVGRRLEVLVESSPLSPVFGGEGSGVRGLVGTACRGVKVELPGPATLIRRLASVRITAAAGGRLSGQLEEANPSERRLSLPLLA
jgi:threonylcarbamoyladenosine tRNA methylthiotransferase MtaB